MVGSRVVDLGVVRVYGVVGSRGGWGLGSDGGQGW